MTCFLRVQDFPRFSMIFNDAIRKILYLGITMPKALFFEKVLITRKPSVEVEKLQKVISKHISEI